MTDYVIEMLNITKEFPGIKANDDVTLQLKPGKSPPEASTVSCLSPLLSTWHLGQHRAGADVSGERKAGWECQQEWTGRLDVDELTE